MKSQPFPRPSPTSQMDTPVTDESQVVVGERAPCRNRTCNLMIKSHIRATIPAPSISLEAAFCTTNPVVLVPETPPNGVRSFPPISHDSISSPLDLLYGNPGLVLAGTL